MKGTDKYKRIPELGGVMIESKFVCWLAEAILNSILKNKRTDENDVYAIAVSGLVDVVHTFDNNLQTAFYELCAAQAKREKQEEESETKRGVKK